MRHLLLRCILPSLLLTGCSSTASLVAEPPPAPVTVDAQLAEWTGGFDEFKDGDVRLDVRSANGQTYVALVSRDPSIVRQVSMMGFELWLTPTGEKSPVVGLHYPMGLLAYNRGRSGQAPLPTGRQDPAVMQEQVSDMLGEMVVLHPESRGRRLPAQALADVQVAANLELGTFTYEVAFIPTPGSTFDVLGGADSFELLFRTPELGRSEARGRAGVGGTRGGAGVGGRGGMRGGGMRGSARRPGGADRPDTFELKVRVQVVQE